MKLYLIVDKKSGVFLNRIYKNKAGAVLYIKQGSHYFKEEDLVIKMFEVDNLVADEIYVPIVINGVRKWEKEQSHTL